MRVCEVHFQLCLDGLEITRKWLLKHLDTSVNVSPDNYETEIRNIAKTTFSRACIELLEWDQNTPYPEVIDLISHFLP